MILTKLAVIYLAYITARESWNFLLGKCKMDICGLMVMYLLLTMSIAMCVN